MKLDQKLSFSIVITIFLMNIAFIQGKVSKVVVNLNIFNRESFKYLTKFSYQIGTGTIEVRAKLEKPLNDPNTPSMPINFAAYIDDDWPKVMATPYCADKLRYTTALSSAHLTTDGQWSIIYSSPLTQTTRTRVWYFVVSDCDKEFEKIPPRGQKLHFEITVRNSDGTHFSEEENGMTTWYFIELLMLITFFGINSMKFIRFYRTEESLDIPFLLLNIAIFFEAISLFLEWFHLILYAENGIGNFIFDLLSQIFGIFSQFLITILIILIASGWSIDYYQIEELDFYFPLITMVGLFHIVIIGLGRINDDDPNKFHDYDSVPGYAIIFLRVIFYAIFLYSIKKTYSKAASGSTKKDFIVKFGILGTIYLYTLPVTILISNIFVAQYVRNKVIIFGTLTIQLLAAITLSYLLSSKKSKYHQISMKGRTLLPSGKLD